MGMVKRMMEQQEYQYEVAREIAIAAGALKQCEFHSDVFFDGGDGFEAAYRLGNYRFSNGQLSGVFETRREMTDTIKFVIGDNYGPDGCWACEKMLAD